MSTDEFSLEVDHLVRSGASSVGTTGAKHAFELRGLGKAPFRFVSWRDTAAGANHDGMVRTADGFWTKPGGTCDYCGSYIVVFCRIESADGRKFKVGTTCCEKVGDAGLVKQAKAVSRKVSTRRRKAREARRIEAAQAQLERAEVRAALASRPHPMKWRADQGDTELDWCVWMLENAGNAGKIKAARAVEAAA